jgi:hypothetical protein
MSSLPQARTLRKVPKMTHDMAQADVLAFTDRNREKTSGGPSAGASRSAVLGARPIIGRLMPSDVAPSFYPATIEVWSSGGGLWRRFNGIAPLHTLHPVASWSDIDPGSIFLPQIHWILVLRDSFPESRRLPFQPQPRFETGFFSGCRHTRQRQNARVECGCKNRRISRVGRSDRYC